MRARLALLVATLPFAFYAYACSSDPEELVATNDAGTSGADDGSIAPTDDGSTAAPDGSSTDLDGGGSPVDGGDAGDAGDGGDAASPVAICPGNPFTPDGGGVTPDGGLAVDGGAATVLTNINGFLDGPQWIDELGGRLVFSDIYSAEILTVPDAGGAAVRLRQLSTPPGNATAPLVPIGNAYADGVIFSAAATGPGAETPGIARTLLDGGALPKLPVPATVGSPNDLVLANGRIYFTDPRYQVNDNGQRGVYQMQRDGGAARAATDGGALYDNGRPNGIALSPDGNKLYVSFTGSDGDAPRIDVFPIGADGNTGAPTAFLSATRLRDLPDGLAVDAAGNLYVAEAEANGGPGGRVEVFSPTGVKWGALVFPNRRVTGVAFGGADNTSLFITTETSVLVFKNRCAGLR